MTENATVKFRITKMHYQTKERQRSTIFERQVVNDGFGG